MTPGHSQTWTVKKRNYTRTKEKKLLFVKKLWGTIWIRKKLRGAHKKPGCYFLRNEICIVTYCKLVLVNILTSILVVPIKKQMQAEWLRYFVIVRRLIRRRFYYCKQEKTIWVYFVTENGQLGHIAPCLQPDRPTWPERVLHHIFRDTVSVVGSLRDMVGPMVGKF